MEQSSPLVKLPDPSSFTRATDIFLGEFKYSDERSSLAFVAALSQYFARLPFENISKILKTEKAMTENEFRFPDEITEDHLRWHLGGTCYSLTFFLVGILRENGFDAEPLLCHMNWGLNSHTATLVTFREKRYLLDPGYLIHQPIPLTRSTVRRQRRSMEGLELTYSEEEDKYTLFTHRNGQFTRRYWFRDQSVGMDEFGLRWHESFSAPLMNGICLTQVTPEEMIYIHNDYLKINRGTEVIKQRNLNEVERIIRDIFHIPLELLEEVRAILDRKGESA